MNIKVLFESNPELASIGTQEQYSQYLDTIFPDSKVKDIVYHGTDKEFDTFKKPADVGSQNRMIAFADDIEYAKIAGARRTPLKKVISALVNINKLYPVDKLEAMELDSGYRDEVLNELKKEGVDGFAFESDDDLATKTFNEVLVFEPEQIHILGGKQDIEGFKEFISTQAPVSSVGKVLEGEMPNNTTTKPMETKQTNNMEKESNFKVYTYTITDDSFGLYVHWSKGLTMHIEKDGVVITLNSNEIEELVKSLPRTIGGKY